MSRQDVAVPALKVDLKEKNSWGMKILPLCLKKNYVSFVTR